ncbi:MAG: hypothetical protein JXB48_15630 [Candidatus Latescibacteria bacterium]|nr:hypothetical protein [Candidatus Latescibacterota bacterium]
MSKIIIGVHGLGNKPPEKLLRKWWLKAIHEGLKKAGHDRMFLNFELVYWADITHEAPLNPNEKDTGHELYIGEPYTPSQKAIEEKPSNIRKKILDFVENELDKIFLNDDMTVNFSFVTDLIIRHFFKELGDYYATKKEEKNLTHNSIKDAERKRMADVLKKHKDKEILLIAHSMGSIIAYDVLAENVADIEIDTFVTMGSPLGIPAVMGKIAAEQKKTFGEDKSVRTPENVVRNWYNLSDLEDKIAFNYNLGDDYMENSHNIRAIDKSVINDYKINGKENHHKIYGYLRTPEMADIIHGFLNHGRNGLIIRISDLISRLFIR